MGGYTGSRIVYTYIIDIDKDQIKRGPDMNTIRQEPACSKIKIGQKMYLVVFGGHDNSVKLDSTEFLEVDVLYDGSDIDWSRDYQAEGIKWINNGPKLPKASFRSRAIPLSSSSVYQLGGETYDASIDNNVFKLTCGGDVGSCLWQEGTSLKFGRKSHIIIPIEDSMADQLCGNEITE